MKNVHFEYAKVSRRFFWFLWLTYTLVYMTKSCFGAAMASIVAYPIWKHLRNVY